MRGSVAPTGVVLPPRSGNVRALRRGRPGAIVVLGAMLLLAGCASRPETGALADHVTSAPGAQDHSILVATTRSRDARPGTYFNGERTAALDLADFTVSVPPNHKHGEVEVPSGAGNPQTDFVVRHGGYIDSEKEFVARLNRRLAEKPRGQRKVLVFIHGYNTMFAEGLYRFAQVVHDSKSQAVPVHFSWASRGELSDYVYDNNSATAARDRLERLFRLVLESNADKVNVLAHSMGNWVTVETMRQMKIKGGIPRGEKVETIMLAAPDIDVDVFKSQMRTIGRPKKPFLIVLSKDDRALALSRFLGGDKARVGDTADFADLTALGAVVIDLTDIHGQDASNHDKFAQIADVAPELHTVLAKGVGRARGPLGEVAATSAAAGLTITTLPTALLTAPIRILTGE